jgi:uncharacterized membrane protein/nitrite reductase/ring-hydroxylating ferredoxin subunit
MRSTANFKTHPIHPALIPFPFAFLTGAFGFDLAGLLLDRASLWTTGAYLAIAGVFFALVAAVPGVIDYFKTVPPESTARDRALKHGLLNSSATVLFAVAWLVRGGAATEPGLAILAMEAVGVVLLMVGGWMGGTLVFRNQIGVDHRYARAGKWSRAHIDAEPGRAVTVATRDELGPDQMKLLDVNGRRIVLGRTADAWVAFDDRCSHRGGSLAGGVMLCGTVHCPWHGSRFDVKSGAVEDGPAEEAIRTYRVEEDGDEVRLVL